MDLEPHKIETDRNVVNGDMSQEESDIAFYEPFLRIRNGDIEARDFRKYVDKPNWARYFNLVQDWLTEDDYNEMLIDIWKMIEFPHQYKTQFWLTLFEPTIPQKLMNKSEYEVFQRLPEHLQVFRGISTDDKFRIRGLSWTLNKDIAGWFAHRFGASGRIYSAVIDKNSVFCYTNDRTEEEIILNPHCLKSLKRIQ